jgi:predicted metal-binding membrane protein
MAVAATERSSHGAYCIGCCWALMALLFIGGVVNVLWIAAIAILVLAEKVVPAGRVIPRSKSPTSCLRWPTR